MANGCDKCRAFNYKFPLEHRLEKFYICPECSCWYHLSHFSDSDAIAEIEDVVCELEILLGEENKMTEASVMCSECGLDLGAPTFKDKLNGHTYCGKGSCINFNKLPHFSWVDEICKLEERVSKLKMQIPEAMQKSDMFDKIIELSTDQMDFVTIYHPNTNPDFDDPVQIIHAGGFWSDNESLEFAGGDLNKCLDEAIETMRFEKAK